MSSKTKWSNVPFEVKSESVSPEGWQGIPAIVYYQPLSWTTTEVCFIEDLFMPHFILFPFVPFPHFYGPTDVISIDTVASISLAVLTHPIIHRNYDRMLFYNVIVEFEV